MNLKEISDKRVRLSSLVYDLDKRCIRLARERLDDQTQSSYNKWKAEVRKRDTAKNLVSCLRSLEQALPSALKYKELRETLE